MDLRHNAQSIDLICTPDARHLVRSLEQALRLRGLRLTLRDIDDRARASFGVAVICDEAVPAERWRERLASYESATTIAFSPDLVSANEGAFLLPSWPSRRADRMLDALIEHLSAACARQTAATRTAARETNPLVALAVLAGLFVALFYAVTQTPEVDDDGVAEDPHQTAILNPSISEPIALDADGRREEQTSDSVHLQSAQRLPDGSAPRQLSPETVGGAPSIAMATRNCRPVNSGRVPPAHLFAWRPLLRAPEPAQIWAQIQPQYYLPVQWQCD